MAIVLLSSAALAVTGVGTAAWASAGSQITVGQRTPTAVGTPVASPVTIQMTASPVLVTAGGKTRVSGSGCDAGTQVFLSVGTDRVHTTTATADDQGRFSAILAIPAGTQTGPLALWAACKAPNPTGKLVNTTTVKVTG